MDRVGFEVIHGFQPSSLSSLLIIYYYQKWHEVSFSSSSEHQCLSWWSLPLQGSLKLILMGVQLEIWV